jgi:hypothetical protein
VPILGGVFRFLLLLPDSRIFNLLLVKSLTSRKSAAAACTLVDKGRLSGLINQPVRRIGPLDWLSLHNTIHRTGYREVTSHPNMLWWLRHVGLLAEGSYRLGV